jgi:hypothetical protein
MATLERIEPAYKPWTPSSAGFQSGAVTDGEEYVGKHRRPGVRGFSLVRMFYTPKHRSL